MRASEASPPPDHPPCPTHPPQPSLAHLDGPLLRLVFGEPHPSRALPPDTSLSLTTLSAEGFFLTVHTLRPPDPSTPLPPRMGGPSTLLHALECMDHLVPHHAFVYRKIEKKKLRRAAVRPRPVLSLVTMLAFRRLLQSARPPPATRLRSLCSAEMWVPGEPDINITTRCAEVCAALMPASPRCL